MREKLSKMRNAANKSNIKLNIKVLNKAWIKLLNEKKGKLEMLPWINKLKLKNWNKYNK